MDILKFHQVSIALRGIRPIITADYAEIMRSIHELPDWPNLNWTVPAVLIG